MSWGHKLQKGERAGCAFERGHTPQLWFRRSRPIKNCKCQLANYANFKVCVWKRWWDLLSMDLIERKEIETTIETVKSTPTRKGNDTSSEPTELANIMPLACLNIYTVRAVVLCPLSTTLQNVTLAHIWCYSLDPCGRTGCSSLSPFLSKEMNIIN